MTNAQIIFNESQELLKAGVIGTTGRSFTAQDADGNPVTLYEPEPIHTFAAWKSLGYSVKKGEHAIAKFSIWKYSGGKKTESDEDANADGENGGRCFLKTAHFFKASQVEPLKTKTA